MKGKIECLPRDTESPGKKGELQTVPRCSPKSLKEGVRKAHAARGITEVEGSGGEKSLLGKKWIVIRRGIIKNRYRREGGKERGFMKGWGGGKTSIVRALKISNSQEGEEDFDAMK